MRGAARKGGPYRARIPEWTLGQSVNMETDLIGKYVQRMLAAWVGPAAGKTEAAPSRISEAFLREHGF